MATETVPNIVPGHVPYEDASACTDVLFVVLTLLYAADSLAEENDGAQLDFEKLTSPNSRLTSLLIQAKRKTAEAVNLLNV